MNTHEKTKSSDIKCIIVRNNYKHLSICPSLASITFLRRLRKASMVLSITSCDNSYQHLVILPRSPSKIIARTHRYSKLCLLRCPISHNLTDLSQGCWSHIKGESRVGTFSSKNRMEAILRGFCSYLGLLYT